MLVTLGVNRLGRAAEAAPCLASLRKQLTGKRHEDVVMWKVKPVRGLR